MFIKEMPERIFLKIRARSLKALSIYDSWKILAVRILHVEDIFQGNTVAKLPDVAADIL